MYFHGALPDATHERWNRSAVMSAAEKLFETDEHVAFEYLFAMVVKLAWVWVRRSWS